jgi:hypothetical protein
MPPGLSHSICQIPSPARVQYASGTVYKQSLYTRSLSFHLKYYSLVLYNLENNKDQYARLHILA